MIGSDLLPIGEVAVKREDGEPGQAQTLAGGLTPGMRIPLGSRWVFSKEGYEHQRVSVDRFLAARRVITVMLFREGREEERILWQLNRSLERNRFSDAWLLAGGFPDPETRDAKRLRVLDALVSSQKMDRHLAYRILGDFESEHMRNKGKELFPAE